MKTLIMAVIATAFSASSALSLEAHYSKDTKASAKAAWSQIGDFCGISKWHPALEKCELSSSDGKTRRKLYLKGGGTIFEELVEQNDETMTQTYVILEGVLPVANYKSTLKVIPKGSGSTFDWSGTFNAEGAPDDEVVQTITGVYTAGVDSLVTKSAK